MKGQMTASLFKSIALVLDFAYIREQLLQDDFLILCVATHPRSDFELLDMTTQTLVLSPDVGRI